jgi:hypothetical protein
MKAARLAAAVAVATGSMAPGRTGGVAPATRPARRKPLQGLRRVRLVVAGVPGADAAAIRAAIAAHLRKSLPELAVDGPADGWTLKATWPTEPAGAPWRHRPLPPMMRVGVSKHAVVEGYEGEFVMYEEAHPVPAPAYYTRVGEPIYRGLPAHSVAPFIEAWRKANAESAAKGEAARQGRAAPSARPTPAPKAG